MSIYFTQMEQSGKRHEQFENIDHRGTINYDVSQWEVFSRWGSKGGIDILFANAGIGELAPLGSITEDKMFSVNAKGLLFAVQRALPLFQEGGSIILNASTAGSKGIEIINEIWKQIEPDGWFNPTFRKFINAQPVYL
jgi:NAD(P)-dependent dehydrogenase (short-subunit alcohol dehydrogenase family)